MITRSDHIFPEIEWERGDIYDTDDHMKYFHAHGISSDKTEWTGTWVEVDGYFDEIIDIE